MNDIMQVTDISKTMSSREIAALTKKYHSHVIRDIRSMLSQIDDPSMDDADFKEVFDSRGYTSEISLNKDLTLTLVAGYNSRFRYAVIKRWQELEQQAQASSLVMPALPNFTNPADAAIAWAEQYKAKEIAQEQLALAAPKVSHYDNVVNRRGLLTATQVGQKIGLSAVKLNKILDELKVYNQAVKRSRVFNSWFIQQGLGELKQTPEGHSQALFSLKGEAWVIERLTSEGAF